MPRNSIEGKTVLIAGGAKNLGAMLARDFASHGARAIAIPYNSASSKGDAAKAVSFQADLSTAGAMAPLFAPGEAALGHPDIAINTVGMVIKKPIVEITEAGFDQSSAVNVKSAFFFLKGAGKSVNDNGNIVTIRPCRVPTRHSMRPIRALKRRLNISPLPLRKNSARAAFL